MKQIIKPILTFFSVITMISCSQVQGGRMDRRKIVKDTDTAKTETRAMFKAENESTTAVEFAELNYQDGNKEYNETVSLRAGKISIPAKTNPSTGYMWKVKIESEDSTILKLDKTEHIKPQRDPSQPMMVGAPLSVIFQFVAEKTGTAKVIFEYKRPWEKENAPEATVVYSITITE